MEERERERERVRERERNKQFQYPSMFEAVELESPLQSSPSIVTVRSGYYVYKVE